MLVAPHAAAGATLGLLTKHPARVVLPAIGIHFLLDRVPHWQETLPPYTPHLGTWLRIPIDLTLAVAITATVARRRPQHATAVWTGAVAGASPDIDFLTFLFPALEATGPIARYVHWHERIQRETGSLWGILPQVAVCLVPLLLSAGEGKCNAA